MKKSILSLIALLILHPIFALEPNPENLISSTDYKISDISKLNINLTFETIRTQVYYGDEITIELYSNNNTKIPEISIKNKILSINSSKLKATKGDVCFIDIYIPKNFIFENIKISHIDGNISLSDIHALDNIEISGNSVNVEINNANASYLGIKNQSGNINVNNQALDYFDISTLSGSITLSLIDAPCAKSKLKSANSNIILSLSRFSDFDIDVFTKTGTFNDLINKKTDSTKRQLHRTYNEGGATINIESTSGNIYLKNN